MGNKIKLIFLLVILTLGLSSISMAQGDAKAIKQPFSYQNVGGNGAGQGDTYLEEYTPFSVDQCTPTTCVINHTGCLWDVNDHSAFSALPGYMNPGAETSFSGCIISYSDPTRSTLYPDFYGFNYPVTEGFHNFWGIFVTSTNPGLVLSVCWQEQNRCFYPPQFVAQVDRKGNPTLYEWRFCGHAVYNGDPLDPAMGVLPNANGGYGLLTNINVSLSNPTGVQAKEVNSSWGISSDVFPQPGCVRIGSGQSQPTPPISYDYPFVWSVN